MTALTQKVQFFKAKCQSCGHRFSMPVLSDFSYGEFVFHGKRNEVFGFLAAHEEPAWDDIQNRLRRAALLSHSPSRQKIDQLHAVVAGTADPIAGQQLVPFPVCPSCGARSVSYGDSDAVGFREIPRVTFNQFWSVADDERSRRVEQLWREVV